MKVFLMICTFTFFTTTVCNAYCSTGFACSLKSLEIKQFNEFTSKLNKFFERRFEEPNFINKKTKIHNYNELFVFDKI